MCNQYCGENLFRACSYMHFLLNERIIKFLTPCDYRKNTPALASLRVLPEKVGICAHIDLRVCLFRCGCNDPSFRGTNVSCDRRGRREAAVLRSAVI